MIDFRLTETDKAALEKTYAQGRIVRKHARHYDEHESEEAPDELPEAADFVAPEVPEVDIAKDTTGPVMMTLNTIATFWGDYAVRLKNRNSGGLGNAALAAAGTPEQNEKWGNLVLSMAITEPGCGSDPSRVQTTAVLDEETNEWVLNGEKIFVTTGIRAEGVVCWASLDLSAGRAGIKSFLVEKSAPGFEVPGKEKKLGIRADDTAAYVFNNCRIPRENLLGGDETIPKGKSSGGFRGVMKTFNMTRPMTAAMGLGVVEAAVDFTRDQLEEAGLKIDYTAGKGTQPAAVERFIELEAQFEASKLVTLQCVYLAGQGLPNNMESSVCKAHAGTTVRMVTQGCIDLLGPMGISRDYLLEKWARDCRITDIYEGTGEIQRLIIARGLLDYTRADLK